jgi:hypothetical protein
MMRLSSDLIPSAHELWFEANARSNSKKQLERERVINEQKEDDPSNCEVDLTDINDLFAEKGRGPHMLEMDFEPMTVHAQSFVSTRTSKETKVWKWKHKYTGRVVSRYPSSSGKSFDTGVLSIALQKLNDRTHRIAYERARHILRLNSKNGQFSMAEPDVGVAIAVPVNRESMVAQWVSLLLFCMFCLVYFCFVCFVYYVVYCPFLLTSFDCFL